MLKPYDLGNSLVSENCHKIKVDDLVSVARQELKRRLVASQIEALGVEVSLTTSKTRFSGERIWFICPFCNLRRGTLYKHPTNQVLGCRVCLNLKYKKQRFKGMAELIV
jgi:hypothetical protein